MNTLVLGLNRAVSFVQNNWSNAPALALFLLLLLLALTSICLSLQLDKRGKIDKYIGSKSHWALLECKLHPRTIYFRLLKVLFFLKNVYWEGNVRTMLPWSCRASDMPWLHTASMISQNKQYTRAACSRQNTSQIKQFTMTVHYKHAHARPHSKSYLFA